jgi:hypothetical protein
VQECVPFRREMGKETDVGDNGSEDGTMVEVQELVGVANVCKPREEKKSVEAMRQTQKDMEKATEQT